jgi:CubicO group peptidase (beta-lactamase class C family)
MKKVLLCLACAPAILAQPPDSRETSIDALLAQYNHADAPGAAVMVIRGGKVLYRRGYGLADAEARVAVTPATNFRLASVTKQFTAMAIMMLAERGKLSLESPLTRFFPDYPAYGKQITVRHLLNHTSGLKAYEELIPSSQTAQVKDRDVLDLLKQQTSGYFPPGSDWRYSNTGYAHLAMIVEKASGMTFAAFLKKNIFGPLKMSGTVAFEEGISTVRNRAYGYTDRGDRFERTDQSVTSAVLGDGGIYSSVDDLFKWDQALYTTKLVAADTREQAFLPVVTSSGKQTRYGFGWEIGEWHGLRTLRHGGSTVGFRTHILRVPDREFTVIVLINRTQAKPEEIADRIGELYLNPN